MSFFFGGGVQTPVGIHIVRHGSYCIVAASSNIPLGTVGLASKRDPCRMVVVNACYAFDSAAMLSRRTNKVAEIRLLESPRITSACSEFPFSGFG